ncbi:MAG: DUF4921 family protein [Planctomycetes bacterium]|nr:DUF4921 family protein [Planctomycetota bacterium]
MSERGHTWVERDASTGRPILVAPGRRGRPLKTLAGHDGAAECPFCTGAERMTPPETDAVRAAGTAPDTPGWTVRAFPNLYPAAPWHEVIAEGAEHIAQPGRLDAQTWRDSVAVWHRRIEFLESRPGIACAFLFKNVGREAGASIAHNHTQVIGLTSVPPRLEQELEQARLHGPLIQRELDTAHRDGRLVLETTHHAAFSPRNPKLPGETWLAAHSASARLGEGAHGDDLADALRLLCAAVDRAFGAPPFNFWLHRIPGADFHEHFELQPRTGFLAGLELGADAYINSLPAAEAAARLRDHVAPELPRRAEPSP